MRQMVSRPGGAGHHGGNVLKDQAYCERIEASPLNSVECGMFTLHTFKRTLVSLAFLLPLVVPGSGMGMDADVNGKYTVYGFGAESCGTFVEARRNRKNAFYLAWVTGYITAVNKVSPTTYDMLGNTDFEGAMLWIENYCNTHPLKTFAYAVNSLVD